MLDNEAAMLKGRLLIGVLIVNQLNSQKVLCTFGLLHQDQMMTKVMWCFSNYSANKTLHFDETLMSFEGDSKRMLKYGRSRSLSLWKWWISGFSISFDIQENQNYFHSFVLVLNAINLVQSCLMNNQIFLLDLALLESFCITTIW